jgi:hypothetical protein
MKNNGANAERTRQRGRDGDKEREREIATYAQRYMIRVERAARPRAQKTALLLEILRQRLRI